ncbi:hypothetical protein FWF74_00085 [Candidatus Saccharibacteria bacterium]|nr:hypothetical protein [Candidatus Saccharibacteria bacterium]MCL1962976.1 hypothetical protein [Candidatus Saccharibacteria bacterium]
MQRLNYSSYAKIIRNCFYDSISILELTLLLLSAAVETKDEGDLSTIENGSYSPYHSGKKNISPKIRKHYSDTAKTKNKVKEYFEDAVIYHLKNEHVYVNDMLNRFCELIREDESIPTEKKDTLLALAKKEFLSAFLAETFIHAVRQNNKINEQESKEPLGLPTGGPALESPSHLSSEKSPPIPAILEQSTGYCSAVPIIIYTDSKTGFFSVVSRRQRRFACLANGYQNISSVALKVILKNYIQQDVEEKSFESNELKRSGIKELLRVISKQSLILTGGAGSGKSTALRWLFLHAKGVVSYVRMSNLNGHSHPDIIAKFKESLVNDQLVFLDCL